MSIVVLLNSDQILAKDAAHYLGRNAIDFAFVYFGTVDSAGHRFGRMSEEYLVQLERVDHALGMLSETLPVEATVLIQSDHGGHDRTRENAISGHAGLATVGWDWQFVVD